MRARRFFPLVTVLIATGCATTTTPPSEKPQVSDADPAENAAARAAGYNNAKIVNGHLYYCNPMPVTGRLDVPDRCQLQSEVPKQKREHDERDKWIEEHGFEWAEEVCALPPEERAKQVELGKSRGIADPCPHGAPAEESPE